MDNQTIQAFTRRLTQCNQGEMIVIIYDIFFQYMEEAEKAYEASDSKAFTDAGRNLGRTLDELLGALDMSYEISGKLCSIYQYCKKQIALGISLHRLEMLLEAKGLMEKLYKAFSKAAGEDISAPIMVNTQQVYAGMTYGRTQLNESFGNSLNRGFCV